MKPSDEDARELGRIIHDRCRELGWADDKVAAKATLALPEDAPMDVTVTPFYVLGLRGVPRSPLSRGASRMKLRAVVAVLGLDPDQVNRLAGGI